MQKTSETDQARDPIPRQSDSLDVGNLLALMYVSPTTVRSNHRVVLHRFALDRDLTYRLPLDYIQVNETMIDIRSS